MRKLIIVVALLASCSSQEPIEETVTIKPDEGSMRIVSVMIPENFPIPLPESDFPYTVQETVDGIQYWVGSIEPFNSMLLEIIQAYKERVAELEKEIKEKP